MAVMDLVGQRPGDLQQKQLLHLLLHYATVLRFRPNLAIYELDQLQNGKQPERELVALGRQPSVPVVFIRDKLVGGSNEIMSLQVDQGGAEERTLEGQGYSSLELIKGGKIN